MSAGTGHWSQYNPSGASSEGTAALLPKNWKGDGTVQAVLYCHGHGQTGVQPFDGLTYPGQYGIIQAIAEAGFPVLSCDLGGGTTWGYTPVSSRISAAASWAVTTYGAKSGKVALVGTSMGGLSALVFAAGALTQVSCIVGVAPVNDMNDMVNNNRGGFATEINGVYPSGWSEATYGATYNPTTMSAAGKYAGLPCQFYIGSSDAIVIPSTVSTLAANIGATATVTTLSGGHAESTWEEVPVDTVAAFVKAHN